MISVNTSINASYNLVKNIKTERLEKNIESIIAESIPYYKSIFKQILLANPNIGRTKRKECKTLQRQLNL